MRNTPPTSSRRVRSAHESKSATVRAAAATPSRRQQSRWNREQRQQQLLFVAVGVLVVVIALIFAGGFIYDNFVRANQAVAQVGTESITAAQLLDETRPQARALDAQAKQIGTGTNVTTYVDQQKRSLPDQVLNALIDTTIIKQEAARRGISVSPAEVDDKQRQSTADYWAATNPTPTPEASPTSESPTPEDAAAAATPGATVVPTPTAVASPTTPTPVPTLEATTYATALAQLLDRSNGTEPDLRKQLEQNLVRDKLQTAIGQEQFPEVQAQVHARQIVVATADQANDILAQVQGGADFGQLVQQYSTDSTTKAKGGDMGWFGRGSQPQALEDAAFALQPGQFSDVIQDASGYHILQVVESDPARQVPAAELTTLRQKAFSDWLNTQRSGSNVKIQLEQSEKNWLLARIGLRP